ncbi:hypothetical protein BGW39_003737 [Mortierella sp. 14UC]|nr:hypothetical protein BGW39_003737 [Mortierella sp. 14UC]
MRHYQPIPDNVDMESGDMFSTAPPTSPSPSTTTATHEYDNPPSPTSSPQYPALRKSWVILSLPVTIAVLVSTSVWFPFGGVLSSSSWPRIPFTSVVVSVSDNSVVVSDTTLQLPAQEEGGQVVAVAHTNEAGMNEDIVVVNDEGRESVSTEIGLGGIEIILVDPATAAAVEAAIIAVEIEPEAALAFEDLREGDDDEDWEEEEEDDKKDQGDESAEGQADALAKSINPTTTAATAMLEEVVALEAILVGPLMIPETLDDIHDGMNLDLSEDGVGTGDEGSVVLLSLLKNDEDEDEEKEEDDEDEQDHFRTNIGKDDDGDEEGDEGDEDDQQGEKPNRKGRKDSNNNGGSSSGAGEKDKTRGENKDKGSINNKHQHKHQDQNANLGGTGGNGPILLCSSKSCLPSLRDLILSKLSVQVHQVMDHLRNRHTLVHMMSSTAPQTKESLIAGQEELVQQLEDRVIKDLRDWVNGVGRKSRSGGSKKVAAGGSIHGAGARVSRTVDSAVTMSEPGTFPLSIGGIQSTESNQEVTAEMEGLFLGGDEFEEGEDDGSEEGFHMASLSFEDADDDDEDHEDDTLSNNNPAVATAAAATSTKKNFNKRTNKLHRRDTHLHHPPLQAASLIEMNRIAVSGENVAPVDQRHWFWNLDKALATVMVASKMICGGPSSANDVKVFLSTLSMSSESAVAVTGTVATGGDGLWDMVSPKALAITLNAQKCIESWSDELEILQRTATTA